jgi:hypothetical protein
LNNGALAIDLSGIGFTSASALSLNILTAAVSGAVPEPATWAMLILGMAAIGYAMRRSNVKFDAKIKRITAGASA